MNRLLFLSIALLLSLAASAQVHVRGYYRKNGTYVAPHSRTRPNHTTTDNYSYPGNYNPNGAGSSSGSSTSTSSTGAAYAPPPVALTYVRYEGTGEYRIESPMNPPLRATPDLNGQEVYSCPRTAKVVVLEDAGDFYCKATVNGHTGYISKRLLVKPQAVVAPTPARKAAPAALPTWQPAEAGPQNYLYLADFDSSMDPPLRDAPSITADEVYTCPRAATVYVLEDTGSMYWKVAVNGRLGYVSNRLLRLRN